VPALTLSPDGKVSQASSRIICSSSFCRRPVAVAALFLIFCKKIFLFSQYMLPIVKLAEDAAGNYLVADQGVWRVLFHFTI
jgi:hypothetical protein